MTATRRHRGGSAPCRSTAAAGYWPPGSDACAGLMPALAALLVEVLTGQTMRPREDRDTLLMASDDSTVTSAYMRHLPKSYPGPCQHADTSLEAWKGKRRGSEGVSSRHRSGTQCRWGNLHAPRRREMLLRGRVKVNARPVASRRWPISDYAPVRDDPASSVSEGQVSLKRAHCKCLLSNKLIDATSGGASAFSAALPERPLHCCPLMDEA